jgi:transcriptional regulator with XRE-family HTH domain
MPEQIDALVKPELLTWARAAAGLSVADSARRIHIAPARLERWERGEGQPTINQLGKLADLCKSSIRRVEERLADVHLLRAKRLLMWMTSLHAVWRVTRLGWTLKHVAAQAGFKSADDLSRLVERTVGLRLAEEARKSSFADLLGRFEHQLMR